MPTTIREGVEDTQRCLASEREIEKRYPDAYRWMLPTRGHVWASRSCLQECNQIELVTYKEEPHFALYLRVKDMSVFYPSLLQGNIVTILMLGEQNPELNEQFVKLIRGRIA